MKFKLNSIWKLILIGSFSLISLNAFSHCCPGPCCAPKPITYQTYIKEQSALKKHEENETFWQIINRKIMKSTENVLPIFILTCLILMGICLVGYIVTFRE